MVDKKVEDKEQPDTREEWEILLSEISDYHTRTQKSRKTGYRVESLYRCDGDQVNDDSDRFNILHTITEMQRPLIYDQSPEPVCRRQFMEDDEVGRLGSEIIERAVKYYQDCDGHEFEDATCRARDDFLIVGRGTARVVYNAEFEDDPQKIYLDKSQVEEYEGEIERDEIGVYRWSEKHDEAHVERKAYEEVYSKHVYWRDFAHSDGRSWEEEVWWVGFRSWLTRDDLVERFGEDVGMKVPLMMDMEDDEDYKTRYSTADWGAYRNCAPVWEVWNKRTMKVYMVAENYHDGFLEDPIDDPYGLQQFFPCPRPIYMVEQNRSLDFVPEYKSYEFQAVELNSITGRIDRLTNSLALRGLYDEALKQQLGDLFGAQETKLFPCDNLAELTRTGEPIWFLPLEKIVQVLTGLVSQRQQNLQIIYEIVGLSDIIRGNTSPRESGKAQMMKLQATSGRRSRMGIKQKKMERFGRDLVRLMAELTAELVDTDTLLQITGMPREKFSNEVTKDAQMGVNAVMDLLRDDPVRRFRIDIETGTTVAPDEAREKDEMFTFFESFSQLLAGMQGAVAGGVLDQATAKELVLWAARRFRSGTDLEDIIERASKQQPQKQEDPAAQAKMMEVQIKMQKVELEKQKLIAEYTIKEAELELKVAELQQSGALEQAKLLQKDREAMINQRTALINATGGNIKK